MDNDIQGRIGRIIKDLVGDNASELGRRTGKGPYAFKDIIGGKKTFPGYELIYAICSSDLGISPTWLITGEGDMLVKRQKDGESRDAILNATNGTIHGDININTIVQMNELINDLRRDKEQLIQDKERLIAEKKEIWEMYKSLVNK